MHEVFSNPLGPEWMATRFESQALASVPSDNGLLPQAGPSFAAHLDKAMQTERHEPPKMEPKATRHSHSRREARPSAKPASAAPGGTVQAPAAPVVADPQAPQDPLALSLDPSSGNFAQASANVTASQSQAQPLSQPQPVKLPEQKQDVANTKPQQAGASSQPPVAQPQPAVASQVSTGNQDQQAPAAKPDAQIQAARMLAAAEAVATKLPPALSSVDSGQRGNGSQGASAPETAADLQRQAASKHLPEAPRQAPKAPADSSLASSKQDATPQTANAQATAGEDAMLINAAAASDASKTGVVLGKASPTPSSGAGPTIPPSASVSVAAATPVEQPASAGQGGGNSDASSRGANPRTPGQDVSGARVQATLNSEGFNLHDLAPAAALTASTRASDGASSKTASPLPSASSASQEQALAAWQDVNSQIGRIVNAAALYQVAAGVEMRLQVRSDVLGPVEIRAALNGDKLGAAIGVQNAEAHTALANQLPALQQSLANHNVQVEHLSVFNGATGGNMGSGSGESNERFAAPPRPPFTRLASVDAVHAANSKSETVPLESGFWRLSVRA